MNNLKLLSTLFCVCLLFEMYCLVYISRKSFLLLLSACCKCQFAHHLPTGFLTAFPARGETAVNISVVVLVAFAGQRSSCSDLVFSNKCALWCRILLRDNTAQAGEFSMATNKTQVPLCQAMSDYLNKCQPRNQTLEHSSSDPQDKGPIDFPH